MPASAQTSPFRLRPAAAPDVEQILELIRGLAEYEQLSEQCVVSADQLREHLFGERPVAEAWVAEAREQQLVGFALFFTSFSTFLGKPGLFLEDLYVVPRARGQGVGHALMLKLARIAVERDYGRFEWNVLDWNARAIRFYEQLGASLMPQWRGCRLTGPQLLQVATLGA